MVDALNLTLSSSAFLLSALALLFNVIFNHKERKRNIRQTLTKTLNEVAKINVAISNLKKQEEGIDPNKISERRNYDFQRNTLIMEADFLIHQNPKLLTAIDCSLAAFTYNELRDFKKAEYYYLEAISRSDIKEMKQIHTRDYASFLFQQDRIEEGRAKFNEAIILLDNHNDEDLRTDIDTFLFWASLEFYLGYEKEFKERIKSAKEICTQLKNKNKLGEMKAKIDVSLRMSKEMD